MNGDDLIFTKGSLNVAQGRKYAIPSEDRTHYPEASDLAKQDC